MLLVLLETFCMVFFAEMGDKTQLLVLAFASKYKLRSILLGVGCAVVLLTGAAVWVGSLISTLIPMEYVKLLAGILFLAFALLSLRSEPTEENRKKAGHLPAWLAVGCAFFIAELGDRTQIATMSKAAVADGFFPMLMVFFGSALAMMASNSLALLVIHKLGKQIKEAVFQKISVAIFALFGLLSIGEAAREFAVADQQFVLAMGITAGAFFAAMLLLIQIKKKRERHGQKRNKIEH